MGRRIGAVDPTIQLAQRIDAVILLPNWLANRCRVFYYPMGQRIAAVILLPNGPADKYRGSYYPMGQRLYAVILLPMGRRIGAVNPTIQWASVYML
jgi:hypothetical protein